MGFKIDFSFSEIEKLRDYLSKKEDENNHIYNIFYNKMNNAYHKHKHEKLKHEPRYCKYCKEIVPYYAELKEHKVNCKVMNGEP